MVCNYEFKKGENKGSKCYGKLYKDNWCKTDYKIDNWNIDYKSILIKSDDKIIEYSKKDNETIYKKEVINNNNIEKIEKKINIFKGWDITKIKEFILKDYNKKKEIQKCKIYYKNKRCTSNLKGNLGENICKFYLKNFCINCERPLTKCKYKNAKKMIIKVCLTIKKQILDNFT